MKEALSRLLKSVLHPWARSHETQQPMDPLDYEKMIHLDAETLAEGGLASAYEKLLPEIRKFVSNPISVVEEFTAADGNIKARAGGQVYTIWSKSGDRGEGWLNAPIALFDIVNRNLENTNVRLYAFYGDNDLSAMFLTEDQVAKARAALPKRSDWPYLLVNEPPHYGFPNAA